MIVRTQAAYCDEPTCEAMEVCHPGDPQPYLTVTDKGWGLDHSGGSSIRTFCPSHRRDKPGA